MAQSLAVDCRLAVAKFLEARGASLTFQHSLLASVVSVGRGGRASLRVTFSRPCAAAPAPSAVVHVRFLLDEELANVTGFQLEEDPHVWPAADVAFDDRMLAKVLDRKLRVRAAHGVDLSDDFASTRLPTAVRAAQHRARVQARENAEELLLELFQRRDPYNDGRLTLADLAAAIRELDGNISAAFASGAGKLPAEVLLALAPAADRDGLVEYGPLVPLAAEAADAWAGWEYHREPDATADDKGTAGPKSSRADKKDDGAGGADGADGADEARAVAAFEVVHKWQTQFLEDKLQQMLEAAGAANAADEPPEEGGEHPADSADEPTLDEDEGEDDPDASSSTSSLPPRPLVVTLAQLRRALESPALLLSAAETNAVLALAAEGSSSSPADGDAGWDDVRLEVGPLPALVGRVRRALFRFQRRSFLARGPEEHEDALAAYLLRQFEAVERDALRGSAQHLAGRLSPKQAKRVVRDELPRLALSLLQAARCVALFDRSPSAEGDRVHYRERVHEMAAMLRADVDDAGLAAAAAALGRGGAADDELRALAERGDEVRAASLGVFRALDDQQLGVVPLASVRAAAARLGQELRLPVDREDEARVLAAAADPTGAGRVSYGAFQHRVLPLALAFLQRRVVCEARAGGRAEGPKQ